MPPDPPSGNGLLPDQTKIASYGPVTESQGWKTDTIDWETDFTVTKFCG